MALQPVTVTALEFVSLCTLSDVRTRRIPNARTASGMLAGLAVNALCRGAPGLADTVTGLVVAVLVLLIPFASEGSAAASHPGHALGLIGSGTGMSRPLAAGLAVAAGGPLFEAALSATGAFS